jgi:hypothetical protein
MRTLETTRVCIIDDEAEEYLELIHALSRLRLGSIHIAGDKLEDLPDEPLSGLRLVFLDMQLGIEGDDAAITSHTAKVFSRVVPSNASPLLVVIWTKHKDLVEIFQDRLYEAYPDYRGKLLFTTIEKPVGEIPAQADVLRTAITTEMAKFYPAEVVWRWEQLVHDAASATTEEIGKLATARARINNEDSEEASTTKLLKALADVLLMLISAEAEKTISTQTALADLLSVLNPLHRDRLEYAVEKEDTKVAEGLVTGGLISPTPEERVGLNTMLFVARHISDQVEFRPGVVFGIADRASFQNRFNVSIGEVFGESLDVPKKDLNDLNQRLLSGKLDIAQREKTEAQLHEKRRDFDNKRDEWLALSVPILLDISPPCDFAQRHARFVRLLSGLMVPSASAVKIQSGRGAFRIVKGVNIPDREGNWDLVFCSRFVFTMMSNEPVTYLATLWRLRDPILTDIRAWCSTQDARLGYVSF